MYEKEESKQNDKEISAEIDFFPPTKKALAIVANCFIPPGLSDDDTRKPGSSLQLTVPGALINSAQGLMRGHGTYLDGENIMSSLGGVIVQTNKLVRVRPVKSRYHGEVGDVVVGRIVGVQQKRWKVDIGGRTHAYLLLASVNLPGGELRRKSVEDELQMREYLREGDLVSAEIQQCFYDGSISLHTRSLRYGKLGQGQLVQIPSYLVRRRKSYIHNLSFGASVILGCNGFVWVAPLVSTEETGQSGGYLADFEPVPIETREAIARCANNIKLLAQNSIPLTDTTITMAYTASLAHPISALLQLDVAEEVAQEVLLQSAAADSYDPSMDIVSIAEKTKEKFANKEFTEEEMEIS